MGPLTTLTNETIPYRSKEADAETAALGRKNCEDFLDELRDIFLRRTKEEQLGDFLPMKDERFVFCELSPLQKYLYKYIIELPDFLLVKHKNGPCDCGVNDKFVMEYKALRTKEERVNYLRRHKDDIVARGSCCYRVPRDSNGAIDAHAVLWRQQHDDGTTGCANCPTCIGLPCLSILYKLSSHVALLQAEKPPSACKKGSKDYLKAVSDEERAKEFLPKGILSQLPGGSYNREDGLLDDHFALSGKMKAMDELLKDIHNNRRGRVLVFSHSTQTLDLIQNYIGHYGYNYRRMDGSTPTKKRQLIADEFKKDPSIFLLLLSTKAMGLGLNLTEANNVIVFDVEWNPSFDEQAQDRAFRIGQTKNVNVYRLISRGTVEELKYLRQVYKTQLKKETMEERSDRAASEQRFRGVEGDSDKKGELFGYANLLKFKDGTFMKYRATSRLGSHGRAEHPTGEDVLKSVQNMSEEEFKRVDGGLNSLDILAGKSGRGRSMLQNIMCWAYAVANFLLTCHALFFVRCFERGEERKR